MCSMNIVIHILLDAHVNASWTESGECEQERQTILDYESQAEQVGLTHAYTKIPHFFKHCLQNPEMNYRTQCYYIPTVII